MIVSLDAGATAEKYGFLFSGLRRRLDEIYQDYSNEQLELINEVLERSAVALREATREHQGGQEGLI